jgi:hypothetical protein
MVLVSTRSGWRVGSGGVGVGRAAVRVVGGAWRSSVSPPERRPALGASKERRPHPASPEESAERSARAAPAGPRELGALKLGDEPVMLCVRVAPSLRRRVKLAAVQSGQPVQQLAAEALETHCQRYGV